MPRTQRQWPPSVLEPWPGHLTLGPCSSLCLPTMPHMLYCTPPLPYSFQTGDSSTSPLITNFMASRYVLTSFFTSSSPLPCMPCCQPGHLHEPACLPLTPCPCISSSPTWLSSSLVPWFLLAKLTTPILVPLEWLKNLPLIPATTENFSRNPLVLERNT